MLRLANVRGTHAALLRPLLTLLVLACVALPGCSTPEESVKPGCNESFLDPALDVADYVERFEGESREIATSRDGIVAALALQPGEDVADIGAGTGLFLAPLHEAIGPDGTLYAVDISPVFMEHLQERAAAEGLDRVQTVLCSDRSADLPADSVDVIFVCDTYHHFEYPRSTLASLYAALRPGGRLIVVDFERIPGVTREWLLEHVRAGKDVFRAEIVAAGFEFDGELQVDGLHENYVLRFRRP